jgi:hypothetical protein
VSIFDLDVLNNWLSRNYEWLSMWLLLVIECGLKLRAIEDNEVLMSEEI